MSNKQEFLDLAHNQQWDAALAYINNPKNNHLFGEDEFNQCNTVILVALGNKCIEDKKLDQAIKFYEQSLKFTPNNVDSIIGLAKVVYLNGQYDDAEKILFNGLEQKPNNVKIMNFLGNIAMIKGLYTAAKKFYYGIIDIDPNYNPAQFNLSKYYLLHNQYLIGFDLYEYRFKEKEYAPEDAQFVEKKWRGEDLKNKTLFVISEQGFGDSILFSRFVSELKKQAKKLIFCCRKPLQNLYQDQDLADDYMEIEEGYPEFDYHIPLLSIPKVTRLTYEDVKGNSYIKSNRSKVTQWKARIKNSSHINVGLVTQGSLEMSFTNLRNCPLDKFQPMFDLSNIDFYSLQPELDPESIKHIDNFHHFADEFKDFSETAAFIENLDLVITVDSAMAHLAGAMGKPVWIMAYFPPTWHWGLEGETTPWYDSARLFRLPGHHQWEPVINSLIDSLKAYQKQ